LFFEGRERFGGHAACLSGLAKTSPQCYESDSPHCGTDFDPVGGG
jgi:hypothetical protein